MSQLASDRNSRKDLVGVVVSRSGDKTIIVAYEFIIPHPLYKMEIKRKTVVHALGNPPSQQAQALALSAHH